MKAETYVDYSLPKLEAAVTELRGLIPDPNQDRLPLLLTKVGQVADDLLRKAPNLISREHLEQAWGMADGTPVTYHVWQTADGAPVKTPKNSPPRDFDYLILFKDDAINSRINLEEYRIDAQGRPIEPGVEDLRNPRSQGFAYSWLLFFPSHRSQSGFRYLGKQRISGRGTLVVVFAQNPSLVQYPAVVAFQGERIPVFHQGIAWIDESTFRIVRLRTDLLGPIPRIHLQRMTAELQFDDIPASGMASPVWLPRQVDVTSKLNDQIFTEVHRYSNYRLYAVTSKIVPETP